MYSKCQPLQLTLTALSGKLSLTSNSTSFFTSATLGPSIVADVGAAQHQRGQTGQRPHLKTLPFALTSHHHTSPLIPHYHTSPLTPHLSLSHFLVTLTFHHSLAPFILYFSPTSFTPHFTHHLSLSLIPSPITSHLSLLSPHLALSHIIHPIHSPSTILIVQEHKALLTILVAIMLTLNVPA